MAKRKSLMDALGEYQEKNEYGRAQRKEEREKKMAKNAKNTKTNTKTAFSTKQLLKTDKVKPGATHRRPPSAPPPVRSSSSSGGGTSSSSGGSSGGSGNSGSTPKARQQATVTRDNRNRGTEAGGIRNTGGRGTTPQATPAKPKRTDFGPGRSGASAYNRAVAQWRKKNSTSTPSTPAGQRSGRRGQGGRK